MVLTYDPFGLDFYSEDRLVLSANARGLFTFEHTRSKSDDDVWEESYKSHRDSRPNGPTAVGMDFRFVDHEHLFGLPEHADNFDLDDTTQGGDPYRLYNLDVFQYELNERMALYVAVPFVMAHKSDSTVGLFWLNAAETWVDVKKSGTGIMQMAMQLLSWFYSDNFPQPSSILIIYRKCSFSACSTRAVQNEITANAVIIICRGWRRDGDAGISILRRKVSFGGHTLDVGIWHH